MNSVVISVSPKNLKGRLKYKSDDKGFSVVENIATIPAPFTWNNDTFDERLDKRHFKTVEKVLMQYKQGKSIPEDEFFKNLE